MALPIIERPSPNHDARAAAIDMLVLHYTGMKTAEEALARLCDQSAKVSAHYTIDTSGCVYRHVPEGRRAWHAGPSHWAGEANVNGRSIGIELVNPGHEFGYVPFTDDQIVSLIDLTQGILARHLIPRARVLAHSDVAPGRKTDPGELFPWQHLAESGIGLWPTVLHPPLEGRGRPRKHDSAFAGRGSNRAEAQSAKAGSGRGNFAAALARFGYGVPPEVDVPLEAVVAAFQRHFRPAKIDGAWDAECNALLAGLP